MSFLNSVTDKTTFGTCSNRLELIKG